MKDKIFGVLQRVGRSFMLPIAILPVAGLFLGIGGSFTNETMLKLMDLWDLMGPGTFNNAFLSVINACWKYSICQFTIIICNGCCNWYGKKRKRCCGFISSYSILYYACINRGYD